MSHFGNAEGLTWPLYKFVTSYIRGEITKRFSDSLWVSFSFFEHIRTLTSSTMGSFSVLPPEARRFETILAILPLYV